MNPPESVGVPYELLADGDRPEIRVRATTLFELFERAGWAMFDLGFDLASVTPRHSWPVVAVGDTIGELLGDWLEQLRIVAVEHDLVFSYFVVDRLEEGGVQGSAAGLPRAEVIRRARSVSGIAGRVPEPTDGPAGWSVDLAFRTEPRLRGLE